MSSFTLVAGGCLDRSQIPVLPADAGPDVEIIPEPEPEPPMAPPIATGTGIVGVALAEDFVYWIERGSDDDLGNYRYDGRLLRVSRSGGSTQVLADGLRGPNTLLLSPEFAYVGLSEHFANGQWIHSVGRIPRAGGEFELEPGANSLGYRSSGRLSTDRFYWMDPEGDDLYFLSDDGSVPTHAVHTNRPARILGVEDGVYLAFSDPDGVWKFVESPENFIHSCSGLVRDFVAFVGDGCYFLELTQSGAYLAVTRGMDAPLRRTFGYGLSPLRIFGSRFIVGISSDGTVPPTMRIEAGDFAVGPERTTRTEGLPSTSTFDADATTLAWTDGTRIWLGTW